VSGKVPAPGAHTRDADEAGGGDAGFGAHSGSLRATPTQFLRKGMGTGGTYDAVLAETASGRRTGGAGASTGTGPRRAGATRRRANPPTTDLRRAYERGDLPVVIEQLVRNELSWKIEVQKLDLVYYLPLFCDGLREVEAPYQFIAEEGVYDLILNSEPSKVLATVPLLVLPLKTALNTRDPRVIKRVLKVLQTLVESGDLIGEALVPYYRQLLPVLGIFKNKKKNLGDAMDYRPDDGIGELIDETLEKLEVTGGPDAFVNIKYLVSGSTPPGRPRRCGRRSALPCLVLPAAQAPSAPRTATPPQIPTYESCVY